MSISKIIIFLLCCTTPFADYAQECSKNDFSSFEEALLSPDCVKTMQFSWKDKICKCIYRLKNLHKITPNDRRVDIIFMNSIFEKGKIETISNAAIKKVVIIDDIELYFEPKPKELDIIPKNIGKLKKLDTLDLGFLSLKKLPSSIVRLKNLRYMSLTGCIYLNFNKEVKKIKKLKNLQKLVVAFTSIKEYHIYDLLKNNSSIEIIYVDFLDESK